MTIRAVLTVLVAAALAVAVAVLLVGAADATPQQPNIPVFTYGPNAPVFTSGSG